MEYFGRKSSQKYMLTTRLNFVPPARSVNLCKFFTLILQILLTAHHQGYRKMESNSLSPTSEGKRK